MKALVYDGKGGLMDAEPGDTVSFTARISSADRRYGEASGVYLARDLYLKLNTRSEVSIIEIAPAFSMLPVRIQHALIGH
ncbi:MAG: hypothetical protein IIT86_02245, partial [Oscillospiraceae bacterium]|nr:hypothetical protein [Oscillospiraceae bacterium]